MNTQPANPTGWTPTQAQIEESFRSRYWHLAIEYALGYFAAGRFAVHAHLMFVNGNLLHHAVEMLLKANLSRDDNAAEIKQYGYRGNYGHSLGGAWAEFKRRQNDSALDAYDDIVADLDKFEDIRYPDQLVNTGGSFNVGLVETDAKLPQSTLAVPRYELELPKIDRLVQLLFRRVGINPAVLDNMLKQQHARPYFEQNNKTPLP
jgi:hypothetical protein